MYIFQVWKQKTGFGISIFHAAVGSLCEGQLRLPRPLTKYYMRTSSLSHKGDKSNVEVMYMCVYVYMCICNSEALKKDMCNLSTQMLAHPNAFKSENHAVKDILQCQFSFSTNFGPKTMRTCATLTINLGPSVFIRSLWLCDLIAELHSLP